MLDIFDVNFTITREHVWHNVRTDKYRASAVDCRIYEILAAAIVQRGAAGATAGTAARIRDPK